MSQSMKETLWTLSRTTIDLLLLMIPATILTKFFNMTPDFGVLIGCSALVHIHTDKIKAERENRNEKNS